jgi:hypothetical protein
MSLIRPPHGNVIGAEATNGTAWLIRQLERALFHGDSALIPEQFDGLFPQIRDGAPNTALNVLDLRGGQLTEDVINDSALIVKTEPNYGQATDLYCADGAYADLAKQFYPAERFNVPTSGWNAGMVGMNIQGFYSQFGPIRFNPDTFLQFGPVVGSAVGDAAKRPSAPTESVAPAAAPDAASQFIASDAGDYEYAVTAINRYGRSAKVQMTGPLTVAAGDQVTMTVADGATTGTAFEVFRSAKGGDQGTERLMVVVARAGATTAITDNNDDIPGTSKAFVIQQNLEFFSFAQLAPFTRIPLATIDTSIRFMLLLYGCLKVYTPGKGCVIKNIARAPASSGVDNAALNSLLT